MSTPDCKEDLRQKLQSKIRQVNGQRTGATLRNARSMVSKREKNELLREVRKKGVRAITQKLGITDRETEEMIAKMISNGDVANAEELVKRITQVKTKNAMDQDARVLASQGPPPEIFQNTAEQTVIPTLPGANPKRKTLKPLKDTLQVKGAFQDWLNAGRQEKSATTDKAS